MEGGCVVGVRKCLPVNFARVEPLELSVARLEKSRNQAFLEGIFLIHSRSMAMNPSYSMDISEQLRQVKFRFRSRA